MGSSRCGYLSADKNNLAKLKNIFGKDSSVLPQKGKMLNDAENLFKNIYLEEHNILNNFLYNSYTKRSDAVDSAIAQIKNLLDKKVNPCDIAIITPIIDDMLKFTLRENFKSGIDLLYLSGNEKLIQNRLVLAAITVLKLNTELKNTLTEFDIRVILFRVSSYSAQILRRNPFIFRT